jgi:PucR family transcriptional regulator, purine catabolism regulatory protein
MSQLGASRHHRRPPTVAEILELEALAGGEVLAGTSGLDREVTGANIVEVPDVYRWLRGGEILFTAGYAWREDPRALVEVLHQLDDIGVSALGVKLSRYLKEVPDEVVAAADEIGLPLIKIPPDVPYREVIEPLYRRLTTRRLWLLERSTHAQELFVSLCLDEQSIDKVASALAKEVGNPVYVVDMVNGFPWLPRPFLRRRGLEWTTSQERKGKSSGPWRN